MAAEVAASMSQTVNELQSETGGDNWRPHRQDRNTYNGSMVIVSASGAAVSILRRSPLYWPNRSGN
jgi:hypothetical protein